MSPFIISIVLISAVMHAGWNLFARKDKDEITFFSQMLTVISVIGFIPAFLTEFITHSLTLKAYLCVIGSGFFCGIYFFALANAYSFSDFTIVYPIARSLPVLFVAIGDIIRGRDLSLIGWSGILLVVAGCFLSPLTSFKDISLKHYFNRTGFWLILTAIGTTAYTLLDKIASEVVQKGPATAARYGYFFYFMTCITYHIFLHFSGKQKRKKEIKEWKLPSLSAFLDFGSYWLILWVYQFTDITSYVIALRQFSILIGVILAFMIYKEKGVFVRIFGTLLLTAGLIIIGVFT
ncbi:MAG TPA: EamA family transporter [Candidatus Ratteibacteria bacterium]|nr:EamA family transporter [Candidatus Ratteibacteria bacterium]